MKTISILGIIAVLISACIAGCNGQDEREKGSIRVTVLAEEALPLVGAKVVSESQPDGQLKVTGITNSDGTVTFNDIQTGAYRFYVSAAGFIQQEFEVTVTSGHTAETIVYMAPDE